jgi:AhpD family alkylhydroperoxidase
VRASLVNGCAFCIDMHWKDARAAHESAERLYLLPSWREASVYSKRERAALALCDAMTLIHDGHVPDAIWDEARAAFGDQDVAQLVFAIIRSRIPPSAPRAGRSTASSGSRASSPRSLDGACRSTGRSNVV